MKERFVYKVVRPNMQSLGLRGNPNVMTFEVGKWTKLPRSQVREGNGDWGGIWAAATLGGARKLRKYMQEREESVPGCRIFLTRIRKVLHENSYRVKTSAVFLKEEVK